jgi:hypothetical protein
MRFTSQVRLFALAVVFSLVAAARVEAQSPADAAHLSKQLNNPISSLISVPFQLNYNENIGLDDDGTNWTLLVQPVMPFSLNEDWNLISRTILPLQWVEDIPSGSGTDFGLGDVTQSLFFSPKKPTASGWIWGAGPVAVLPLSRTSDSPVFGKGEWAGGVTGVALRQTDSGWTIGALANHVWNLGGDTAISNTYLQPFIAYTTPTAWTLALNSESTYDWKAGEWSMPFNLMLSKLVHFGKQPVSFQGGIRYWADGPDAGPEGWGARFAVTFLFPK